MTEKPDPRTCEHEWRWDHDDYGSLAGGGSCAIYKCTKCGAHHHSPLPD